MTVVPVFVQVDSLPGSQTEPSAHNRHTERTVSQNRAHMGWHIVGPFCGMLEFRIAVGHATRHESLEIPAHRRIGVLAQHQRGTGVVHENKANTGLYSGFGYPRLHFVADRITAPAAGRQLKRRLENHFILPFV